MDSAGSCVQPGRGSAVPASEVGAQIRRRLQPISERETVSLRAAFGRVLAEPLSALAGAAAKPGTDPRQAAAEPLPFGRRIGAVELGVLATLGYRELQVLRRPRVAVLCTGDELVPVGTALETGQIHDGNRYLLHGLLAGCGVTVVHCASVRDEARALRRALGDAAGQADAVLTTGGVSGGDADLVPGALEDLGSLYFGRIAVRPGGPMAFGRVGAALVFSLAGKPAGVMAAFRAFVGDALRRLGGESRPPLRPLIPLPLVQALSNDHGRHEYVQAKLVARDGRTLVAPSWQEGGRLGSMAAADCYIVLPAERRQYAAGEMVMVYPFGGSR